MPGDLRKSLRDHLGKIHPTHAATQLQATTRSQIHHAIIQANKELERFGYYIAVVTDTGSMISAKVFGQWMQRDFGKPKGALIQEFGYPINLQLSLTDEKGMTIYSSGRHVITSKKPSEIEDAIYRELETQIKSGIDASQSKGRNR